MVIVRRVREEAAHFRRDAAGPEEPQAISGIMHPELKGQAALRPPPQSAGDTSPGYAGHFCRERIGKLPVRAGAGIGLTVIEAERSLRGDGEAQRLATAGAGNRDVKEGSVSGFLPKGRDSSHFGLLFLAGVRRTDSSLRSE